MDCEDIQDAISARLDGEDPRLETDTIWAHLSVCATCRRWEEAAVRLGRGRRVAATDPVPDQTAVILGTIASSRPANRPAIDPTSLRGALGALGLLQLIVGAPALFLGVDGGAPIHVARELGSFDLALAVGFIFAAWRPVYALGMLPLAAALVAGLAGAAAADVARGRVSPLAESAHLSQLVALTLVWLVARVTSRSPRPASHLRPS